MTTEVLDRRRVDEVVIDELQQTLVELIDLSLQGKQAHWNVSGPLFRSIHLELDEIVDVARLAADEVAERLVTVGVPPDGRAATIAAAAPFQPLPAGIISSERAVRAMGQLLDDLAERLGERIKLLAEPDPISQGILITIAENVEKRAWMLRAQLA
jgi:starvation-inducible DNA-binding protein